MKIFYKGEYLKTITKEEAEKIYNYKGVQVMVGGELLKKSQIEIKKESIEQQNKMMSDYTKEELHSILGNFEEEYNQNATGKSIHNEILGFIKEGTIDYALKLGAITKYDVNGKDVYFIKLPEYNDYHKKLNALRELIGRRNYAKNKDLEAIIKTRDKVFN